MKFTFRWIWFIIVFALLVPIDLPAGGSFKRESNYLQLEKSNLYFANDSCYLRSSPSIDGSCISYIPLGTPLRFVRSWKGLDGKYWFQVQVSSLDILGNNIMPVRGWINV